MSNKLSYRSLLQGLHELYNKVSLIVLHNRVNSYHTEASHVHRKYRDGIKTPMTEFIESTVAQATSANHTEHKYEHLTRERQPRSQPAPGNAEPHRQLSRERIDELSKYFKERNKGAELQPPIREKLEHSVWDHIHATIRCAHQGDERNAKMHLDIATTACKELGHYMDEEEYQAFVKNAEDHMETLIKPRHTD